MPDPFYSRSTHKMKSFAVLLVLSAVFVAATYASQNEVSEKSKTLVDHVKDKYQQTKDALTDALTMKMKDLGKLALQQVKKAAINAGKAKLMEIVAKKGIELIITGIGKRDLGMQEITQLVSGAIDKLVETADRIEKRAERKYEAAIDQLKLAMKDFNKSETVKATKEDIKQKLVTLEKAFRHALEESAAGVCDQIIDAVKYIVATKKTLLQKLNHMKSATVVIILCAVLAAACSAQETTATAEIESTATTTAKPKTLLDRLKEKYEENKEAIVEKLKELGKEALKQATEAAIMAGEGKILEMVVQKGLEMALGGLGKRDLDRQTISQLVSGAIGKLAATAKQIENRIEQKYETAMNQLKLVKEQVIDEFNKSDLADAMKIEAKRTQEFIEQAAQILEREVGELSSKLAEVIDESKNKLNAVLGNKSIFEHDFLTRDK
ncbi:uncharacterized protein LOC141912141 [Tubulanus polymorphus]|uniref:uncharacterized protein LOC141912141 n=1 Tax=Tubulanus polymorphus TaxID=672921 RepID=UPI003DA699AC